MSIYLQEGLEAFGITYNNETLEKFNLYRQLLVEWNNKFNLTAIRNEKDIDILHFLDSATVWNDIKDAQSAADVGSGAGFPGIPLKILGMGGKMVLFDSLKKRIGFLETVIKELGIENCSAVHSRAEDAGRGEFRESFEVVTARAVANMSVLSEYCIPLLKKNGIFIAMKGKDNPEEIQNSLTAIKKLGGEYIKSEEVSVYGTDAKRNLIFIKKAEKTPAIYPRKAGTPAKRPL